MWRGAVCYRNDQLYSYLEQQKERKEEFNSVDYNDNRSTSHCQTNQLKHQHSQQAAGKPQQSYKAFAPTQPHITGRIQQHNSPAGLYHNPENNLPLNLEGLHIEPLKGQQIIEPLSYQPQFRFQANSHHNSSTTRIQSNREISPQRFIRGHSVPSKSTHTKLNMDSPNQVSLVIKPHSYITTLQL